MPAEHAVAAVGKELAPPRLLVLIAQRPDFVASGFETCEGDDAEEGDVGGSTSFSLKGLPQNTQSILLMFCRRPEANSSLPINNTYNISHFGFVEHVAHCQGFHCQGLKKRNRG